ncbi:MAG: 2-oxoacid:ferredoxin oxidoreductase subunit beta [Acidobacteria bacterium]|nr:2-oxoacid:ferredoxin oxidoreductase subunit beta [Acidobacteriota bacterium]
MSTVVERPKNVNRIGLTMADYRGADSTLCAGCGHDAITSQIIKAFWELGIEPHRVAKMSGIGCSSKTPAYFLNRAHGFNAVHGRMPAVATGAMLANRQLICIGVSGDGDTASIGLGQFCHMLRRNVPVVYVIEDNGVYGLTKGQFSATADEGSRLKTGVINDLPAIDCCSLAIEMGCSYVARSFAGDPKQLVALLEGALAHNGTAMLDVISPCVTFNNHEGSTKSYKYAKEHEELLHEIGFVPFFEQIQVDYDEGTTREVEMHDGSRLLLKKLARDYNPFDRREALRILEESRQTGEVLTGLVYVNPACKSFLDLLHLCDEPLATLPQEKVRPPQQALDRIMAELK